MRRGFTIRIIDCIAIIIITATGLFLWNNRTYFSVPDPDIFQYIYDGRQYAHLKLPNNIQTPPVNSILIATLAPLFKSYEYPEIVSAHTINAAATFITLSLGYWILRGFSPLVGLGVTLLLITNPTFIFPSLNVNSEVLFTTFVMLTILLYKRGRHHAAFIIAGLSFLVRYEGALLVFSLVLLDLFSKHHVKKTLKLCVLALVPIAVWLSIINYHNHTGTLVGNTYIQEVIQNKHNLPQFLLLARLPFVLMDYLFTNADSAWHAVLSFFLYVILLSAVSFLVRRSDHSLKLIYLFTGIYLLFHIFFPFAPDRYLYPILWSLYLAPLLALGVFAAKLQKNFRFLNVIFLSLFTCTITLIVVGNSQRVAGYYQYANVSNTAYPRYYRSEIRLASDWLNSHTFTKPVVVVAYDRWTPNFYTHNTQVDYLNLPFQKYQACDSIICLINTSNIDTEKYNIFFLKLSSTFLEDEGFPSATNFNVKIFNQFPTTSEKNSFVLLAHVSQYDSWAKIYQYLPE